MADIDAKIAELKAATREANETLKALIQAKREFSQAVAEAKAETTEWRKTLEKRMEAEWEKGLADYHSTLLEAVKEAEASINKRMDVIAMMITKPYNYQGKKVSLEDLVAIKTGHAVLMPEGIDVHLLKKALDDAVDEADSQLR